MINQKPQLPHVNTYLNHLNEINFLDLSVYEGQELITLTFSLSSEAQAKMGIDFLPPLMKEAKLFKDLNSDTKLFDLFRVIYPGIKHLIEENFINTLNEYYIEAEKNLLNNKLNYSKETQTINKKLKV